MPPQTVFSLQRRLEEGVALAVLHRELVVDLAERHRRADRGDELLLAGLDADVLDDRGLDAVAGDDGAVARHDGEVCIVPGAISLRRKGETA